MNIYNEFISQINDEIKKGRRGLYFCTNWISRISKREFEFIADQINGQTLACDTWHGLTSAIHDFQPNLIVIHIDTLISHAKTSDFVDVINMLRTMCNHIVINETVFFAVVIDSNTPREQIKKLQKFNDIMGIVPSIRDFGITAAINAIKIIYEGKPYWPENIIYSLPPSNPISVYFRSDWKTAITAETIDQLTVNCPWKIHFCETWDELSESVAKKPHQIVFHIDMIKTIGVTLSEFVSMIDTMIRIILPNKSIPIGVCIDKTTPLAMVKELQKAGIHGIIPTARDFGVDATHEAMYALFNRKPYWPSNIINQLPTITKPLKTSHQGIQLTTRQQQVLDLVCNRGLSNKKIASSLSISESTVKIHVSSILKSYGVRSRTQLVLAAKQELHA